MGFDTIALQITLLTSALAGPSYSIPQIFTNEATLDNTFAQSTSRSYLSLTSLKADFATDSLVYNKASQLMSQKAGPLAEFRVFLRATPVQQVKTVNYSGPILTGGVLNGTVNGTALTVTNYTTDSATTLGLIAVKIAAVPGVTSAIVTANHITVTAISEWNLSLTTFTSTGSSAPTVSIANTTPGSNIGDDITTAVTENKAWYVAHSTNYVNGSLLAAAPILQANEKFGILLTADTDTYTNVATDVISRLELLGYNRTSVWHTQDTSQNLDAAIAGRCLVKPPGSVVFWGKILVGVTASTLTDNQISILLNKFGNVYVEDLTNITKMGTMTDGTYMDIIRDVDYSTSQLKIVEYTTLTKADKSGYIDATIATLDAAMHGKFKDLFNEGVIKDNYKTFPPAAADIDADTRASRILTFAVPWTAELQGAVQQAVFSGVVSP